MPDRTVVVLGGGSGGIVAARRLRKYLDASHRVVLVERDLTYRFQPSFGWVMAGLRRPEQITTSLTRLRRRGIDVLGAEALEIDPSARTVKTTAELLHYDRLVVSLGAELAPEALPGFPESALSVYTLDGAIAAGRALRTFEGGRLVVAVSGLPYKCPAAPWETALLAEALLRKRGVRRRATIQIYTPEPYPMPTAGPALGAALAEILAGRGIEVHAGRSVERIDAEARELVLGGGERAGFDLLLGVPRHRAPEVVRAGGLGGESGFIPVDRATLQTAAEGVYAVGDVTAIPIAGGKMLPKAAVFAHGEAEVVARRIASEFGGRKPTAEFDGAGACFVEMGDGVAAYATGNFYASGAPAIRLRRPSRWWHLGKVALERYWMRRWF